MVENKFRQLTIENGELRIFRYIVLSVCTLCSVLCTPAQALTVEQEQQFTYYWYAAKQAIEEQRYSQAYVLLEFCHLLAPDDAQTLAFLGVLYGATGQSARSMAAYQQAFELAPADQWQRYSDALLNRRTDEGKVAALRVYEKALDAQKAGLKAKKRDQLDEDLLEQLRKLYVDGRQWKKALATQDEIDRITGYDAYSAYYRYRIYAMWGKPKKAIEAIDKYIEIDPTDIRFLRFRIELMELTKASKEEIYAMYDRVLEIEPYNLEVLNDFAYLISTRGGDLNKAERMSAVTIREEPNNPAYLDTYGWILHLQGQDELALFYLKKALWNATEESIRAEVEKHMRQIPK